MAKNPFRNTRKKSGDWLTELNRICDEECDWGFDYFASNKRAVIKYFKVINNFGANIKFSKDSYVKIQLPSNMIARENVLLHILTKIPRPNYIAYSKTKDEIKLSWSF